MSEHVIYPNKQFFKDYWYFVKPFKGKFIFLATIRLATSATSLIPIYLIGLIIDFFTNYTPNASLTPFYLYVAGIVLVTQMTAVVRLTAKYNLGIIGQYIKKNAKVVGFEKLMEFDLAWHEKELTGKKVTRITTGASSLQKGIRFLSHDGTDMMVNIIGIAIIFSAVGWKYTLLVLIYLSIYLANENYFNKKKAQLTNLSNIAVEKAAGFLIESSSNILTAKAMGLKKSLISKGEKLERKALELSLKERKIGNNKWKIIHIISASAWGVFLLIMGSDVISGAVTVGSIMVYSGFFSKLYGSLNRFSVNADDLIKIKYGLFRMMNIFNEIPQIQDHPDAKSFPKKWKEIKVDNVHFKYKKKDVLKGISFTVKKGEKIGIVGRSGSGKSTLFKLFTRMYDIENGSIRIGNTPISMIKHQSLTDNISIALQDTELFNMSLKENVELGSFKPLKQNTYQAIDIAQLSKVADKLPYKEKTLIGEKGVKLSGGERQRLGIARAILKDADIILFDEATSNLDSKTEELLHKGLKKRLKNKTVIMTAHRLSTLKDVDKIIVMQRGKIVEQGTYNKLLKNKGLFYKLHKLQSKIK